MRRLFHAAVLAVLLSVGLAGGAMAQNGLTVDGRRITASGLFDTSGHAAALGAGVVSTADPTVTASSAYASGNWVGGLLTFTGVVRSDGPLSGILQSVTIQFKSSQTAATDFVWCSSNPSATTVTDKTAVALAVADYSKCRPIHVTDCTNLGTPSTCSADGIGFPIVIASGTTGYGFLVTRGTPTFTATTDVEVQLRILQD